MSTWPDGLTEHDLINDWQAAYWRFAKNGQLMVVVKVACNWRIYTHFTLSSTGEVYCYNRRDLAVAIAALNAFEPERDAAPGGWFMHVGSNRCRTMAAP